MKKICPACLIKQKFCFKYQKFSYYKCINCKTTSTYPFPSDQTIIKHYEKRLKGGNYQLLLTNAEEYKKVYTQFLDILKLFLKKHSFKGVKLLDVGSFTGDFMYLAQKKGADVYGLELQKEAVKIANKKMPKRTIEADITSSNVKERDFDVITLFGLIEHVTNPEIVISSSAKKLKKNGIIMIQTPNSASLFALLMRKFWPPFSPIEHIHLFSRRGLESLLKKNGFEIIMFKPHVKSLPIQYVYNNLKNFGPELYRFAKPLSAIFNSKAGKLSFPFYIGEMIIVARKIK